MGDSHLSVFLYMLGVPREVVNRAGRGVGVPGVREQQEVRPGPLGPGFVCWAGSLSFGNVQGVVCF